MLIAARPAGVLSELQRLKAPVLFITGDDDRIVPAADTQAHAALIPQAKVVVIPECGHLPHEERPEVFMAAVSSFLSTLSNPVETACV